MNKKDAEKVIEDLKDKPFICGESTIETDSGYVISLKTDQHIKTNADRIRSMSNEELAKFLETAETLGYIDESIAGHKNMLEWLQSEVEG